jgi:hypothetical protein
MAAAHDMSGRGLLLGFLCRTICPPPRASLRFKQLDTLLAASTVLPSPQESFAELGGECRECFGRFFQNLLIAGNVLPPESCSRGALCESLFIMCEGFGFHCHPRPKSLCCLSNATFSRAWATQYVRTTVRERAGCFKKFAGFYRANCGPCASDTLARINHAVRMTEAISLVRMKKGIYVCSASQRSSFRPPNKFTQFHIQGTCQRVSNFNSDTHFA